MARVKMTDPVEYKGNITTLKELADNGKLEFTIHTDLEKRNGDFRTGYYAKPKDFNGIGWEISKYAYESRINKIPTITEPEQTEQPIRKTCENCKWYLTDFSVGISGECECDQWPETITDEQIDNYIESYGENCPGHQFKKWL